MKHRAEAESNSTSWESSSASSSAAARAQPLRGTVDSWRDSNGHEVDAIISVRDNMWGAFEVKLGHDAVEEAAESLLRFTTKVDTSRHGEPAFLGVIISNGSYAYRREDGVHVIPIGCLGP